MIIKADDLQKELQELDKLLQDRQPELSSWCMALGLRMDRIKRMIEDAQNQTNVFIVTGDISWPRA